MLSKISIGINVLLAIAVAVLFVRTGQSSHPVPNFQPPARPHVTGSDSTTNHGTVVAFVNGDSIMARYAFFLEMKKNLEASYNSSREKMEGQISKAQKEYNELMNYAQSKGDKLPADEQQDISNRIMELEYTIQTLKAQEEDKLIEKEQKLNEMLLRKIASYVKEYASVHQIDIVLNYQELAQVVLYGSEPFDITTDVINGLNQRFEEEKATKKK